jgi:hypothetical protein
VYQPGGPGTYTHVLTNTVTGCSTSKNFTIFSTQGYPTYTVTSLHNFTLGCAPSKSFAEISYTNVTAPGGGAVSYTLLSSATGTATVPFPVPLAGPSVYTITTPGAYTAVVRGNQNGCETRIPFTILSNTLGPLIDSVTVPRNILDCDHPQVTLQGFTNNSNAIPSWMTASSASVSGSILTVNSNTASSTTTVAGTYSFVLYDSNNTCKSTTIITIYQNLYKPIVNITPVNSTITCASPTIILTHMSTTGIPPGSAFPTSQPVIGFLWSGPPPQSNLSNSSSYVASVGGAYTLVAKDLNNGCTASGTATVISGGDFPAVSSPPGPFCLTGPVVIISPVITGNTANYTYSWTAPAGAMVSGVNTASLATNMVGVYTVSVSSQAGCTSTAVVTVSTCTDVAVSELSHASQIKIYPNPGQGIFVIEYTQPIQMLEVYDYKGVLLVTKRELQGINEIDLTGQAHGLYFISIKETSGLKRTYKIVKD